MSVSKRLRFEILRRDNHQCRYCGGTAPEVKLQVDHVVPTALGGSDDPTNLVAACVDCNAGKSASSPDAPIVESVSEDALRWSSAMQEVARIRNREREDRDELWGWFNAVWCTYTDNFHPDGYDVPADWINSVAQFLKAGLTQGEIESAVHAAATNRSVRPSGKWRYFCGICHTKIRKNMELAADLIERGVV